MTDGLDPTKPLKYARHAFVRMIVDRGFVGRMVEEVVYEPDWNYSATIPGGTVLVKTVGEIELHVVCLEFPDYYLICSVFEDEN